MNSDLNPNPNPLYTPVQPQNQVPKGIGNRTTLPFVLIIGGALLQLYASGLVGTPNAAFLERAWGIVILAAGLDFLLVQRRFISGAALPLMGGDSPDSKLWRGQRSPAQRNFLSLLAPPAHRLRG